VASKKELEALIILAGKIDPSLKNAINTAAKQTRELNKETSFFGRIATSAWDKVKTSVAIGTAAIGAALTVTAKKGLDLASDLTEVQNVVDVTFGQDAQKINEWSKTALKAYGLSELSAKRYASTLGAMMKSSGVSNKHLVTMSKNLTALAGDFASFYNLDAADAFEKIKAGIAGETEPLKALGINMTVANLEAYALSKGIKTAYEKMSQADQVLLRYNYLLEMSKDAQWDFARTQNSFANQQRIFGESFKQLSAKIMSAALPAFTRLYQKANQLIDSFMNSPEKVQKFQNTISNVVDKIVAAIPTAIRVASNFGAALVTIFSIASKVFRFIYDNWSLIKPIIIGIVGAMLLWKTTLGIISVYESATKLATIAQKMFSITKMKDAAITLYLQSLYIKDAIVKGASTAATWTMTAATKVWNVTAKIAAFATRAFGVAIRFLTGPIGLVIMAIAGLVAAAIMLWKNWDQVSSWVVGIWQNYVLPFFQGIGSWFANLWSGLVAGFQNAWSGISSWFTSLFDGIFGILKGFVNTAIKGINYLIKGLNKINIKVPDWVPGIGGKEFGIHIPEIPTFARGGLATQPSIFGEAGPEMAIPIKRTPRSLGLLNQTARMLGVEPMGGGSPQFIFAPVINGGSSAEIESKLRSIADDMFAQFDAWWEAKRRESFA
jgi:hypothetical protein